MTQQLKSRVKRSRKRRYWKRRKQLAKAARVAKKTQTPPAATPVATT